MTMDQLREYVTAPSTNQQLSPNTILLHIKHSNLTTMAFPEFRVHLDDTIAQIKQRVYKSTGTLTDYMELSLFAADGTTLIATIPANASAQLLSLTLRTLRLENNGIIYVKDTDPFSKSRHGGLEDITQVKKFEISDEAYQKRGDNYRKFKEEQMKKDPSWTLQKHMQKQRQGNGVHANDGCEKENMGTENDNKELDISVDSRCEVFPGSRRGCVKYVGQVSELGQGVWIGVAYDEPVGKHDGQVNGVRYFSCKPNHGGFVKPHNCQVGEQFAEEDELQMSDDEL
eukprot:CAMPEP_0184697658 /NCGR_PEP_ID=MMETSP0313-20130426/4550_1 /TAXON_ID=2792 /ORGANISM="Porphyridium aerugineum, Strain SAG 1380-2" /LENGTH=284 /DNA_ID=CAMNT_0027156479 /DNA_START=160 /DNA_END=1014 /DNA_ORIENTATION=-